MEMVSAKVAEKDPKFNRETILRDFVRFSWRATRGLTSAAEAEGKELVRKMVEIGRVSEQEGDRLMSTLMSKMLRSREQFEKRVDFSVQRAVEKLGEISTKELSKLTEQATRLEQRLNVLQEKKRGR